jgi:pyruvate dehydrogenase E2 component (dihydrolipoamide acetyltransferase)
MQRVVIPKLDLQTQEAEIVRWHKKEGEEVKKEELLLEISTDKANVEIGAPATGVLTQVASHEGEVVKVGQTIAYITNRGESPPQQKTARVRSTPIARQLCSKSGITVEEIYRAIGREPITEQEVSAYLKKRQEKPSEIAYEEQSLSPLRKLIARRVQESAQQKPHIFLFSEIEVDSLLKREHSEKLASKNIKVTLTDLLLKITAMVLPEFPRFNATLVGESGDLVLRKYKQMNIGLAVSTERGLVVPVVKDVGGKSLSDIAQATKELVARARENKLCAEELTGGSFTVSNLGMYGVQSFIPIINPPEVAILAIGSIQDKLSLQKDKVKKNSVISVCLGMDHRAVDGADGARFLQRLKELVEDPNVMIR